MGKERVTLFQNELAKLQTSHTPGVGETDVASSNQASDKAGQPSWVQELVNDLCHAAEQFREGFAPADNCNSLNSESALPSDGADELGDELLQPASTPLVDATSATAATPSQVAGADGVYRDLSREALPRQAAPPTSPSSFI